MTCRPVAAVAFVLLVLVLVALASTRRAPTSTLQPLQPRGQQLRGVEVFAAGRRANELVTLAEAVHRASAVLFDRVTSPGGLRIHTFPTEAEYTAYVRAATGRVQPGAAYVCLGAERLIVLQSATADRTLQHELAHDVVQTASGVVPRWFSEGVATHVETWRDANGTLVASPGAAWAQRCLELSATGELLGQAAVEDGSAFERTPDTAAYARSWATVDALLLLQRATGKPLRHDHGVSDDGALDELGLVLAQVWAWPARRRAALLEAARTAGEAEAREVLLGLAELVVARQDPSAEPAQLDLELARALRDLSTDAWRRRRAATVLAGSRVALPDDWRRLAAELGAAGGPRAARWAQLQAEPGAPPLAPSSVRLEQDAVVLVSTSWDPVFVKALAPAVIECVELLRRRLPTARATWTIGLELPGRPSPPRPRADVEVQGWPDDPQALQALADALRLAGVSSAATRVDPWENAALGEALHKALDPVVRARSLGVARAGVSGPFRTAPAVLAAGPPGDVIDPTRRALLALHIAEAPATASPPWETLAVRAARDAPCDALPPGMLIACDPGHARSREVARRSLAGPERVLLAIEALFRGAPQDVVNDLVDALRLVGRMAPADLLAESLAGR